MINKFYKNATILSNQLKIALYKIEESKYPKKPKKESKKTEPGNSKVRKQLNQDSYHPIK